MRKHRLVIFDLDGTLADTSPGILECHRYANAAMGRTIEDESVLEGIIGGPLLRTYMERFGYPEREAREAVRIYREHYAEEGYKGSVLYPGIEDCLAGLKKQGRILAVATLKAEPLARHLLARLGIAGYFDLIHGVDGRDTLTKSDLICLCLEELRTEPGEAVLVGDSIHDAEGARQAGVDFLGVSYGFGFKGENGSLAQDCRQLLDWLTESGAGEN